MRSVIPASPFLIDVNIPVRREQRKRTGAGARGGEEDAPTAVTMKSRDFAMLGLILDSLIT